MIEGAVTEGLPKGVVEAMSATDSASTSATDGLAVTGVGTARRGVSGRCRS